MVKGWKCVQLFRKAPLTVTEHHLP